MVTGEELDVGTVVVDVDGAVVVVVLDGATVEPVVEPVVGSGVGSVVAGTTAVDVDVTSPLVGGAEDSFREQADAVETRPMTTQTHR